MCDERLEVRFYTRPGCHLCDVARPIAERALAPYRIALRILNVEDDPALESRYGHDVPVIEVSSSQETRTFRNRLDPEEFEQEIRRLWNT